VQALRQRFPETKFVAPLGLGGWFRERGIVLAAEVDWWQEVPGEELGLGKDLSLLCLPAQHWANRWPWDHNETLWCGYGVVERGTGRRRMPALFCGDTGYCSVFAKIGELFHVGLAAIPIGAYEPRWMLSPQHVDPAGAVHILRDLRASHGLAIHWGTFPLTPETPVQQLADLTASGGGAELVAVQTGDFVSPTRF